MNFIQFRRHFPKRRYFTTDEVRLTFPDFRLPTLTDWQGGGLVRNLARGVWEFVDMDMRDEVSLYVLSGFLVSHSYVSLEMALRHYDLIPEEVYTITAVTTTKTQKYTTPTGRFVYQKIPERAFAGYTLGKIHGQNYQMATPEKALLDYLWLHKDIADMDDFEGLRFNPFVLRELDTKQMRTWAEIFGTKPYLRRVENLISFISLA